MLDYRPDWDQTEPGRLRVATNILPTAAGTYTHKSNSVETGYTSLPSTCIGTAITKSTDGSLRLFAATATNIYEADTGGAVWNDESRTTGGAYSTATSWEFAQFGTVALAASYENQLQHSTSGYGGNFMNLTGAPNGKHIVVNNNRVILFNTQGYTGSGQDAWAASDIGDYTVWTPSSANNAAQGRLLSSGPITAAAALGGLLIAWKLSEMWIGTDNGPPDQITWQRIPGGRFGCVSKLAWVNIDAGIIFVGPNDIWFYDGSRPRSIADGVRDEFFSSATIPTGSILQHDERTKRVIFYRGDNEANWVYNYASDKWGRQTGYNGESGVISAALNANNEDVYNFASGILRSYISTARQSVFVFPSATAKLTNSAGTLGLMRSGASATFFTNYFGDYKRRASLTEIYPAFLPGNLTSVSNVNGSISCTVTGYRGVGVPSTMNATFTPNAREQKLDGRIDANFFRASFSFSSDMSQFEIKDMIYTLTPAGTN